MKMLTIEFLEKKDGNLFWITGRCCRDDIFVGDILSHDTEADIKVVVKEIEVYHKKKDFLAHGYVGGVIVRLHSGNTLPSSGFLISM